MGSSNDTDFRLGLDNLLEEKTNMLRKKKVGLITNPTGLTGDLVSNIEAFLAHPDINLVALFGPEHGVRGDAQAGKHVNTNLDKRTGLPEHSLYGKTRKPTPEMLDGIDALIFDIQDVGVRFYTYPYTLLYAMQAVAESEKEVIVLDRPNPITGTKIEGNIPNPRFPFFGGCYPLTTRYGLTIGEVALMLNQELSIGCNLKIVKLTGWKRNMWYDQTGLKHWIMPSPNIPTLDTTTLYPGICLIEGTNLSEGRGTTKPFELVGAPWIDPYDLADELNSRDIPGVKYRATYFTPSFEKHAGKQCGGVQIHITDRDNLNAVTTGLHVIDALKRIAPDRFKWRSFGTEPDIHYTIDGLCGTDQVRKEIDKGSSINSIVASWEKDLTSFLCVREKYLIYD